MSSKDFFVQPAPLLAPALIGKTLVRVQNGERVAGLITETEAYQGQEDLACHARAGRTRRTEVMFGEPGRAYIYFTYGMHWLLNIVADQAGSPAAVLIRAIFPLEGLAIMEKNRPIAGKRSQWLNGPAKLTQAFGLNGSLNGHDLRNTNSELFLEDGISVPGELLEVGPRVGLGKTPEPWLSMPWRWVLNFEHAIEKTEKGTI